MLIAAVVMDVRALIMCRNEAHKVLLEQGLYDWMFQMSSTDEEATFFISRAQLIKQYGLEPDEEVPPLFPKD